MKTSMILLASVLGMALATAVCAAPANYTIDPDHTHPEIEADHFGGLSVWRGIFKKTTGTIVMDKVAGTGTVDVDVDTASIDMAMDKLSAGVASPEFLDSAKYPVAHYHGTLADFVGGGPTVVKGELTLHGVTKPVDLKILSFKCMQHPVYKREVCGADATGSFDRSDFGITMGKDWGFKMGVTLRIQVEAIADK